MHFRYSILDMKTVLSALFLVSCSFTLKLEIGPDNFMPEADNVYLCGSKLLDKHSRYYITAFTPKITLGKIHHFAIAACYNPGSNSSLWNSKASEPKQSNLPTGPICENKERHTLFDWSYNTSNMVLPEGVSYEVGYATRYRYLVFEVHYPKKNVYSDGIGDSSKLILEYTTQRTKFAAGFLAVTPPTNVTFYPGEHSTIDVTSQVPVLIHPMFYQVHTHGIGTMVSGYIVKFNSNNPKSTTWTRLGKRDPLLPQNFIPTETKEAITPEDIITVRCHYYNFRSYSVKLGNFKTDEMCDMFIIFWTSWNYQITDMLASIVTNDTWQEYGLMNIPADE